MPPLSPQRPPHPGGPGTIIIRILTVLGGLIGVVIVVVLVGAGLVFTGDPSPCVNRRSTPSQAAAAQAQAAWDAFKAAGAGAKVEFSELEATSRGVTYVDERDLPVDDLQIYFCPDGTAQAKGTTTWLGRDVNILASGHLDVGGGRNVLELDSVEVGNLPSFIGTAIANQILDRNNARELPFRLTLTSSITRDGVHTLSR